MGMKIGRRLARLSLLTSAVGGAVIVSAPAAAQMQIKQFDIPAQSLSSAILEFSRQSDTLVIVSPDVAAGKRSRAVRGAMPVGDAISRLLSGTDLRATANPAGGYRIEAADPDQKTAQVGEIVVTGQHSTTTATKTDTPLIETPQAISVIPKELLELRNVQRVREALQLTAGVLADKAGADTRYDEIWIRGFSSTEFGDYRDGLRQPSYGSLYFHNEPYGLESIEVLKGPSSVLFGQNAPGGLVNVQSKRPTENPVNELAFDVGSFALKQVKFDVGGSLTSDGSVEYRVVGLSRQASTFLSGDAPNDRLYVEPSIRFKIGDRTTLTLYGEYLRDKSVGQFSVFVKPDGTVTNVRTYDPDYDRFRPTEEQVGYSLEHDFSGALKFKQNLRYSHMDLDYESVGAYGLEADNRTIDRLAFRVIGATKSLAIDNQLQGRFNLGDIETRLLGGVDYLRLTGHQDLYYGFDVPTLDLYDPVYGVDVPPPALLYNEKEKDWQAGGYFQGQFKYRGWILTGGGRYDHAVSSSAIVGPAARQSYDRFTYRVALSHLFSNGLAPYVSYSTSFQLTPGTTFGGTPFKPTSGRQIEGGVKYSPHGLPGFITADVFQIKQQNVLTLDPDHGGFSVQTGEVRSRGIELEGTLRPIHGLDLQASYTYLDVKVIRSNLALELGKEPPADPRNQASFLASYTFKDGALKGFGFGGDVRYEDRSWKDQGNTQRNPATAFVDAFTHYDIGPVRLTLRADNLFDKHAATCSFGYCYQQMPRDVIGSVRFQF